MPPHSQMPTTRGWEDVSELQEPPQPDEPAGEDLKEVLKWAVHEPPNFDLKLQQLLQPGARPEKAFEVSWVRPAPFDPGVGRGAQRPAVDDAVALEEALQPRQL